MRSRWRRGVWRRVLPVWIAYPLVLLGAIFLFFYPLGIGWSDYALAIGFAVVLGLLTRSRVRVQVLEYSETDDERIWLARQVWKKTRWRRRPAPTPPPPAQSRPSSPEVTGIVASSGRIVLPAGVAPPTSAAEPVVTRPPASRRSRVYFWIGAVSLLLSVIFLGGFLGLISLIGGMTEWTRAKRAGDEESRRKALQAAVLGGLAFIVGVTVFIVYSVHH
jgi:hypothetical protein